MPWIAASIFTYVAGKLIGEVGDTTDRVADAIVKIGGVAIVGSAAYVAYRKFK